MQKLRTATTIGCGPQQNTSKHRVTYKVTSFFLAFYLFCWNVAWKFYFNILKRGKRKNCDFWICDILFHKLCANTAIRFAAPLYKKSSSRLKVFPCSIIYDLHLLHARKRDRNSNGLSLCHRPSYHIELFSEKLVTGETKTKTHVCMTITVWSLCKKCDAWPSRTWTVAWNLVLRLSSPIFTQ